MGVAKRTVSKFSRFDRELYMLVFGVVCLIGAGIALIGLLVRLALLVSGTPAPAP